MTPVQVCPIYTIGNGKHTQIARRAEDGTWFMRQRRRDALVGHWGPWRACIGRPYEFSAYVDTRAGNAKLPAVGGERHAPQSHVD